jgi:tetratricopeptide (TPR) repeat protein
MGWGWWNSQSNIMEAAARCEQQVTLARRQAEVHQNERVLTHLLLGAIADSQRDHATAFAEFEKALQLDNADVQALEYAGLQLLKLTNPLGAVQHFQRLAVIAEERGDNLLLARAHRQLALAHEQLGALVPANQALLWAVDALPPNTEPLEVAHTHEQHGRVRGKAGYANTNESLQRALVIYSGLNHTRDGQAGISRIRAAIVELNKRNTARAPDGSGSGDLL